MKEGAFNLNDDFFQARRFCQILRDQMLFVVRSHTISLLCLTSTSRGTYFHISITLKHLNAQRSLGITQVIILHLKVGYLCTADVHADFLCENDQQSKSIDYIKLITLAYAVLET